ncbi:MAG TPA: flagellar export chaperone FliS [Thermoclostridium caenicola]|jgi:flagellar protein FliS|nr:flagellar export chaperone FliS [Clostridiaceae bacterium]HOK43753.1 flagellar export chaperone FliS [Thermoclostridium caenicola]
MIAQNAYNQYREKSIQTARPEELTLMLYNGLVKFIMRAIDAVQKNKTEDAHNNIIRAQDIIQEFMRTLDKRYPIAVSLELLYDYMYRRLVEANLRKDVSILTEVLDMAKQLRDVWEQAMKLARHPVKKIELVDQAE